MGIADELYDACRFGRRDELASLIAGGADIHTPIAGAGGGSTPLTIALLCGQVEIAGMLLAAGAPVDQRNQLGHTPLFTVCHGGYIALVQLLCSYGADVNLPNALGNTPLLVACIERHTEILSILLAAGAAVDQTNDSGMSPLFVSCIAGDLAIAQQLSSYGASRRLNINGGSVAAEEVASERGLHELAAWLATSRAWSTPLHHLTIIDATRSRILLRDGADLHAAAEPGGPTPLSLAQALDAAGEATDGFVARLVLDAAKPWSEATHALFPLPARLRAAELLRVGFLLSRQERFNRQETALFDLWREWVMPHAVGRGHTRASTATAGVRRSLRRRRVENSEDVSKS